MGLNKGLAANVVQTALDKVYKQGFDGESIAGYSHAVNPVVFKQDSTDRSNVIQEQFKGAGYFQEKAEQQDVPQADIEVGNQKTSNVVDYEKAVDIPKTFFDDDLHSVVRKGIEDIGRLARLTQDRNAHLVYNNGFGTQTTNDAVAFFSNSHVTIDGTTVDNLETGTLTEANVEAANTSVIDQLTQDGTLGSHSPRLLLAPTALLKEATIVVDTELRPGTGNNDINYISRKFPGLEVMFSPFLSAAQQGSDTAWFLLGTEHSVTRYVRESTWTFLVPWQNQRNNNYIYKSGYREVVDVITFEGAVGSDGSV